MIKTLYKRRIKFSMWGVLVCTGDRFTLGGPERERERKRDRDRKTEE